MYKTLKISTMLFFLLLFSCTQDNISDLSIDTNKAEALATKYGMTVKLRASNELSGKTDFNSLEELDSYLSQHRLKDTISINIKSSVPKISKTATHLRYNVGSADEAYDALETQSSEQNDYYYWTGIFQNIQDQGFPGFFSLAIARSYTNVYTVDQFNLQYAGSNIGTYNIIPGYKQVVVYTSNNYGEVHCVGVYTEEYTVAFYHYSKQYKYDFAGHFDLSSFTLFANMTYSRIINSK
ncbi:hypothetical protein Palpr_2525 [Paludibacter propionicigenes WB4]|uniref:Lipoprotein n=1 Tax=Paludibacter propionicigenes (strain DSM 17365 / JCM 13257 / WB4) TaxID=694427 RepID=E4T7G3_PALPW|nr:hypothetical protein [Paludibacter propionicigenes]ADQ80657.1 hypothetical protein Palpr_2525 [Paludibacter propionicigenes WB4]